MSRPARLEAALKRLAAALDQLEAAGARLSEAGATKADLEDVIAAMQDDRGRLAHELDGVLARARTLEQANDAVAERLARAGGALRHLIQNHDSERG